MPLHGFKQVTRGHLEWIECSTLARFPWLLHAFSTRRGGVSPGPRRSRGAKVLNLGMVAWDKPANVEQNRQEFLRQIGAGDFLPAALRQVHSTHVFRATRGAKGGLEYSPAGIPKVIPEAKPDPRSAAASGSRLDVEGLAATLGNPKSETKGRSILENDLQSGLDVTPEGDALLGDEPGVLLTVKAADCLPILLVDPRRRAIAAVHAGWRGALGRIAEKTVGDMRRAFDSRPEDLYAVIGPSIRACCYEVGSEVADAFRACFAPSAPSETIDHFFRQSPRDRITNLRGREPKQLSSPRPPKHVTDSTQGIHLDLVAVVRHQLRSAGVRPARIRAAEFCTACRTDLFFSYRKEGELAGRMMAVIGIRPPSC